MVWKRRKKRKIDPLEYAAMLMRYRPRSIKEMERRLSERYSTDEVERTISILKERGILDDERFAFMMARNELEVNFHGPRIIKSKLVSLGVDEETASAAIEKAMEYFDPTDTLKRLMKRFKDGRKLREYLYRRGFDPSIMENLGLDE